MRFNKIFYIFAGKDTVKTQVSDESSTVDIYMISN